MGDPGYFDEGRGVVGDAKWLGLRESAPQGSGPRPVGCLDEEHARVRAALDLPRADDLLAALHHAAADERYRPISEAGDHYASMLP